LDLNPEDGGGSRPWLTALLYAIGIDSLVIGLFYYWFGSADRHLVFLYDHEMGPFVPDTSPFSPVTSSRYWMAGLVAVGAVMVLYLLTNWILGRLSSGYGAPVWWRVWLLASPLLALSIPLITMTLNQPVMTPGIAAQTTIVMIAALALALSSGRLAVERPVDLIWLAFDGLGLMMVLVTLPGLQFLGRWLENGRFEYIVGMTAGCCSGLAWLIFMSVLRVWRRRSIPSSMELLLAGFAVSYLFLPLIHHLVFTDGYRYITDSENFFARNMLLQMAIWLFAIVVSVAAAAFRNRLASSRQELAIVT